MKYYYIRHDNFVGNALVWWRPNHKGYTTDIREAGKYSEEIARSIANNRESDTAYEVEKIEKMLKYQRLIIHADILNEIQNTEFEK